MRTNSEPDEFEVFEENWPAFMMATRLQTQFIIEQGFFVGFNYQSIEMLFRIYEIPNQREVFEDVQVIEAAALSVLNKKG